MVRMWSSALNRVALSVAAIVLFTAPHTSLAGGVEIVEIGNLQLTKTLGGIVVAPDDSPLADVEVIEVAPDWQTTVRKAKTDRDGRWSLPPVSDQKIYYLRFVTKQCCFNEVRCRVRLNKRKGKGLTIKLPLSM